MIKNVDGIEAGKNQDFARLVELQQQHSEVTLKLEQLETRMSDAALRAATTWSPDYVVLQEQMSLMDGEIKALFERHPEWREDGKKSIKTPFGSVEQRTVPALEVPNPAVTVTLIKARGKEDPKFDVAAHLHVKEEPNLEALEGLSDAELAKLGVRRVITEKITVKAAKVSAAKVAKAAAKTAKAN